MREREREKKKLNPAYNIEISPNIALTFVCMCVCVCTSLSFYAPAIIKAVEAGNDVNEVEAAGNTPLHSCCYEGWLDGAKLLLDLGAKVNASNNAGDRPIHWAQNMGHTELEAFLKTQGADDSQGQVLVPDHVPKVKDFHSKECWASHPMPHREFIELRHQLDDKLEKDRNALVPGAW